MVVRSEPFMFSDLTEDSHGTMVFELAEPGKPNDLFVKLQTSVIATVPAPQIQTGAVRRVTKRPLRPKQLAVRQIILNAVHLKSGEPVSISPDTWVYPIQGANCCDEFDPEDEGDGECDHDAAGDDLNNNSIAAVTVGIKVDEE